MLKRLWQPPGLCSKQCICLASSFEKFSNSKLSMASVLHLWHFFLESCVRQNVSQQTSGACCCSARTNQSRSSHGGASVCSSYLCLSSFIFSDSSSSKYAPKMPLHSFSVVHDMAQVVTAGLLFSLSESKWVVWSHGRGVSV